MSGWSWYDRRTDKRTTSGTFLTRESAQERLDYWLANEVDLRPDLGDLLHHIEVREVTK